MGSQPYKASARSWKPLVDALNFESEMAAALAPRMDLARTHAPFLPASGGGLHQQCGLRPPLFPSLPRRANNGGKQETARSTMRG